MVQFRVGKNCEDGFLWLKKLLRFEIIKLITKGREQIWVENFLCYRALPSLTQKTGSECGTGGLDPHYF